MSVPSSTRRAGLSGYDQSEDEQTYAPVDVRRCLLRSGYDAENTAEIVIKVMHEVLTSAGVVVVKETRVKEWPLRLRPEGGMMKCAFKTTAGVTPDDIPKLVESAGAASDGGPSKTANLLVQVLQKMQGGGGQGAAGGPPPGAETLQSQDPSALATALRAQKRDYLSSFAQYCEDEEIDGMMMIEMDDEDLQEAEVSKKLHRRVIVELAKTWAAKGMPRASADDEGQSSQRSEYDFEDSA